MHQKNKKVRAKYSNILSARNEWRLLKQWIIFNLYRTFWESELMIFIIIKWNEKNQATWKYLISFTIQLLSFHPLCQVSVFIFLPSFVMWHDVSFYHQLIFLPFSSSFPIICSKCSHVFIHPTDFFINELFLLSASPQPMKAHIHHFHCYG